MRILLDTNVLVGLVEPKHLFHQAATEAVHLLGMRKQRLCIVPQVFCEYWVVSTRPTAQNGRGRKSDDVAIEIAFLEAHFEVLPDTARIFDEWKRLVSTCQISGKLAHDARLAAAMIAHGVRHVLTSNDADFRRFPNITVLTPAAVVSGALPS
ncbi:MAG: type II toxin-antitoxin system VapC family toxin [Gemmataceae bacterium]|nr:type II toxin-antitoxin system VapC family toxin [Gemmataceae bacterium]